METGKLASFSVCPMIQNRMEIPSLVEFCEHHGIDIFFNIVNGPLGGRIKNIHEAGSDGHELDAPLIPETSMRFLDDTQLAETIEHYRSFRFRKHYQNILNGLISQLEAWKDQKDSGAAHAATDDHDEEGGLFYKQGLFDQLSHVEDKEDLYLTLEAVAERVQEVAGNTIEFYKQLYFSPPDVIIDLCRRHTTEELFEIFQLNRERV